MSGMVDTFDRDRARLPSAALRGVELWAATVREPQPPPVLWSQLALVMCASGGADVAWGRAVLPLGAGAVLVRAPHQISPLLRNAAPETRCRQVLVEPELLTPPTRESQRLMRGGSLITRAVGVVEGVNRLWDAVEHDLAPPEQQERLSSLLAALIELARSETPRPAPLSPAVARTRDALHERFVEELPLEHLALTAGMSKCHLVHLFHKEMGLPPHAYQVQLRVARARALVSAGVALAEVATMTGFADQSHLTRLFKRVVGVPPGRYAAELTRASCRPQPDERNRAAAGDSPRETPNEGQPDSRTAPRAPVSRTRAIRRSRTSPGRRARAS